MTFEERFEICKKCPLYSIKYGGICNNKLYVNFETNDVSTEPLEGYVNGCGCILSSKLKNPNQICHLGRWD